MKFCFKCKLEKQECEFHKNKSHKGGLSSYCKPCAIQQAQKNNYKDMHKVTVSSKKKRKIVRQIVETIKEKYGCCLCPERIGCCLSFHHVNNDKDIDVGTLVLHKTYKKLFAEINKCVVVCENCHRKVHRGLLNCDDKPLCSESLYDFFTESFGRLYIKEPWRNLVA